MNNMRLFWVIDKNGNEHIFLRKPNIKSAFCLLGLNRRSWPWLIMKARHPVTKLWNYFMDKCLPFGSSISCSHFQSFSNALKHLVRVRTVSESINNYLDDFLFVAATLLICNFMIQQFMDLCAELNIPIAEDKMEWATLRLVFLGILLNGQNMTLVVPDQKRVVVINMLKTLVDSKKATIKELQSLCGYLNFLNKAVVLGRTFTRRMYAKFSHVVDCTGWNNSRARIREISSNNKPRLKPHYHVCLDAEFKSDCSVWIQFLESKGLEGVVLQANDGSQLKDQFSRGRVLLRCQ